MPVARLRILARYLEENVADEDFDLGSFVDFHKLTACACGYLPKVFPDEWRYCANSGIAPKFPTDKTTMRDVIEEFFQLSSGECHYMFGAKESGRFLTKYPNVVPFNLTEKEIDFEQRNTVEATVNRIRRLCNALHYGKSE